MMPKRVSVSVEEGKFGQAEQTRQVQGMKTRQVRGMKSQQKDFCRDKTKKEIGLWEKY